MPTRQAARDAACWLPGTLTAYRSAEHAAHRAGEAAAVVGKTLPWLTAEVGRAAGILRGLERAAQGPEKALEVAAREIGSRAVGLALAALPRPLQLPARLAVRAVERVIERGLDLGLGR